MKNYITLFKDKNGLPIFTLSQGTIKFLTLFLILCQISYLYVRELIFVTLTIAAVLYIIYMIYGFKLINIFSGWPKLIHDIMLNYILAYSCAILVSGALYNQINPLFFLRVFFILVIFILSPLVLYHTERIE